MAQNISFFQENLSPPVDRLPPCRLALPSLPGVLAPPVGVARPPPGLPALVALVAPGLLALPPPSLAPSPPPCPPGPPGGLHHLLSGSHLLSILSISRARSLSSPGLSKSHQGRVESQLQLWVVLETPGELLGVVHEGSDLCEVVATVGNVGTGPLSGTLGIHSVLGISRLLLRLLPE